jgi:hypothetical protein
LRAIDVACNVQVAAVYSVETGVLAESARLHEIA